jgi:zinc protease
MSSSAAYSRSTQPSGAQLCTLPNGLTVILLEDRSSSVVSVQAWCEAGSIHEGKWLGAGLSHVLEHMLFKGTKTRGKGRIDQEVQEAGGYMNAYTSFDRTVYYINAPSSGAGVAVDILTDIMQNATLPEDELVSELDVIRREMDMNHDDPSRLSGRGLFETAYLHSPYRYTVIGYPDVFDRIRREDVFEYYQTMYTPSNQFFVVVGDMNTEEIMAQICEAYQDARFRPLEPPYILPEPRQLSPRQRIEESPIELGHAHVSWHIPDVRHQDLPALEAFSILMGGGRSSRLYRCLREELGIAHAIDAWTYNPGKPGLFGASAVFDGDQFTPVMEALQAEIDRTLGKGISESELSKTIKQFTSATLSSRKTMQGQAQDLGSAWMAARDLNFSDRYLKEVQSLTPAQVIDAAKRYLVSDNRSLFALLPEGCTPRKSARTTTARTSEIEKWEPDNGMRVLFMDNKRLPFVEVRSVFYGGVLEEAPQSSGITQWMSHGLLKGTAHHTAAQLMESVESVGGSIESYAGNNSFGLNIEVLNQDAVFGMETLQDILRHSTFPEQEMERERQVQLAGIRSQKDHLLSRCFRIMRRGLFGETQYGLSTSGEEGSVQSLQLDKVQAHFSKLVVPGNQVTAVFGDIDVNLMKDSLMKWWENAPKYEPVSLPSETPEAAIQQQEVSEKCDKKQAVVVFGFKGTTFFDKDRYALDLIQETCSDLGSRLFMRIRDELGLAYYVGAQHMPGLVPGYFGFYAGTSPEHVKQVKAEFLAQFEKIKSEGITRKELDRSKAKLLGQKQIARQDLGNLAMNTALDELYGLGYENHLSEDKAIQAVTLEDIQRAAQTYFVSDRMTVATVGP